MVSVNYGRTTAYEWGAKVEKAGDGQIKTSWDGYSESWDEWLPVDFERMRILIKQEEAPVGKMLMIKERSAWKRGDCEGTWFLGEVV